MTNEPSGKGPPPWGRARILTAVVAVMLLAVAAVAAATMDDVIEDLQGTGLRSTLTMICGVAGLAALLAALLWPSPTRLRALAWFSAAVSVLCVAATVFIWVCVAVDSGVHSLPGRQVSDPAQTEKALAKEDLAGRRTIPTGLMIETMQYTDSNNVKLTGYIWQRLPKGEAGSAQIDLPDAVDGGIGDEIYRDPVAGGDEVVGWRLSTTVREKFDYSHYPLDRQVMWLVMWPKHSATTALVPDFGSYPPWDAHQKYGMYQHIVSGEWQPQFTTFGIGHSNERTSYGRPGLRLDGKVPELSYSIGLNRAFLSPLLDRLVPLAVIAMLVFASLFVVTKDSDRRSLSGFSTWAVIGFCGSMMLVVSVQHSSLRSATGAGGGIVYAEYFYFILYLVIGLVALNAVEHTSDRRIGLVDWRGNAAARLLYWPVTCLLLFAVTTAVFVAGKVP
ncbi:hypothetical protein G3I40_13840 [Streptomyces sp. SID14478]|uniref:hypothetical protein n=1 Tax=Streptomyces sp. SID14478 TaxID=2706073 RepID=UPI0013D98EAF|nr:hypothetical protein [Streptomyces sp. SID14478]NEB76295.1 hypothetical protein [Streptomyces sp. SID14478]